METVVYIANVKCESAIVPNKKNGVIFMERTPAVNPDKTAVRTEFTSLIPINIAVSEIVKPAVRNITAGLCNLFSFWNLTNFLLCYNNITETMR